MEESTWNKLRTQNRKKYTYVTTCRGGGTAYCVGPTTG